MGAAMGGGGGKRGGNDSGRGGQFVPMHPAEYLHRLFYCYYRREGS